MTRVRFAWAPLEGLASASETRREPRRLRRIWEINPEHPFQETRSVRRHQLICTRCGVVVTEFADDVDSLAAIPAREYGFEIISHRMELRGRCALCREGSS